MREVEAIAMGLTKAQRVALCKMPLPFELETARDGKVMLTSYATAKEIGASGSTLLSMYGLGGCDPETLELGPILVVGEWGEGGRRWYHITDEGLAVRTYLEQANAE